jgi:hypothetical protein
MESRQDVILVAIQCALGESPPMNSLALAFLDYEERSEGKEGLDSLLHASALRSHWPPASKHCLTEN